MSAHVADITQGPLAPAVPEGQVSAATLFFVLSALSPDAMPRVSKITVVGTNARRSVCCRASVRVIERDSILPLSLGTHQARPPSALRRWRI